MLHDSDSAVQREAERLGREKVAEVIGKELTPMTVKLESGASVQVDAVASDESVFAVVFAHQGALKGGQRYKVAQDALKLITIRRTHPAAELLLVFLDDEAAGYPHGARGSRRLWCRGTSEFSSWSWMRRYELESAPRRCGRRW